MNLALTLHSCFFINYDKQNITTDDADLNFRIVPDAFLKIMEYELQIVAKLSQTVPIPNQYFNTIGFDFELNDIKFANADLSNTNSASYGKLMFLQLDPAFLEIVFTYKFQQTSYPYMSGVGHGQAVLKMKISIETEMETSTKCPYHQQMSNFKVQM